MNIFVVVWIILKFVVTDFEYCSYNYRGFDIANHMLEWTYDYTEPNPPYYRELPENYPTEQQRLNFVQTYLSVVGSTQCPSILLKEVKVYSLASHLFWALWAIVNAGSSQITFGYWVSAGKFRFCSPFITFGKSTHHFYHFV